MATLKDIANHTGLGIATVSKYLNGKNVLEKNRIAIEEAIDELGYTVNQFARGLKTNKSNTVGVVIPELSNLFITSIITAMEDVLRKNGYGVIICDCRTDDEQEKKAVSFLINKMADGIINMPVSKDGAHLKPALDKGIPIILIDRMIPSLKNEVSAVLVDNVAVSANAVTTLIKAGHKNIGVILGPRYVFTSQQRLMGYNLACVENKIAPAQSSIVYSDYTVQGGYQSLKQLMLMETKPTAVFATNYEMTLGAIIAINEMGIRIPEELSFIGFDNLDLSLAVKPNLSIVLQPLTEIGEKAAELLLNQLASKVKPFEQKIVTLPAEIKYGGSIAELL